MLISQALARSRSIVEGGGTTGVLHREKASETYSPGPSKESWNSC